MKKTWDKLRQNAETIILDLEEAYDITITIHDLDKSLTLPDGSPLLAWRHLHRHPYCWKGRETKNDHLERCRDHCQREAHHKAESTAKPWLSQCWKGVSEVIVPINGSENSTEEPSEQTPSPSGTKTKAKLLMYGGAFRSAKGPLTAQHKTLMQYKEAQHLKPLTALRIPRLERCLNMLGHELLRLVAPHSSQQLQADPRTLSIKNYLHMHAHRSIQLKDLAEHLHLSPSRCSHLVKERFGIGFKTLLNQERMSRSKRMLTDSPWSIEEIAYRNGYPSAPYFFRLFKSIQGMTPRQYREQNKRPRS